MLNIGIYRPAEATPRGIVSAHIFYVMARHADGTIRRTRSVHPFV